MTTPRKDYENLFPLDTFHGETKEQLLQLIESLIAEAERKRTEEIIEAVIALYEEPVEDFVETLRSEFLNK